MFDKKIEATGPQKKIPPQDSKGRKIEGEELKNKEREIDNTIDDTEESAEKKPDEIEKKGIIGELKEEIEEVKKQREEIEEGGKESLDNLIENAKSAEEKAREMIKEEWGKAATEFQTQTGEDETKLNIPELKKGIEIFRNYQKFEPGQVEVTMNLINNLAERTDEKEVWQKILKVARESREVIAEEHKNTVDGEEKIIPEMHRKLLKLAKDGYYNKHNRYFRRELLPQINEIVNDTFPSLRSYRGYPRVGILGPKDFRKARELAKETGTDHNWTLEIFEKTAELTRDSKDYQATADFIKSLIDEKKERGSDKWKEGVLKYKEYKEKARQAEKEKKLRDKKYL